MFFMSKNMFLVKQQDGKEAWLKKCTLQEIVEITDAEQTQQQPIKPQ